MKKALHLLFTLLLYGAVEAQDIHFSQYYNIPLNINPALTGVFQGDIRVAGNYRSQWSVVPVSYETFSAAFDMKYAFPQIENGYFAFGGVINRDEAGDANLSLSQVNLSASYTRPMSDQVSLTAGFQFGFGQRSFEMDRLLFENQWIGDAVDPNLDPREPFRGEPNVNFMDLGTGLNLFVKMDDEGQSFANIGLGLFHLNRPKRQFDDRDDLPLPMRLSSYVFMQRMVNDRWGMLIHALGHFHGPSKEFVGGLGARYVVSSKPGDELALHLLTAFRQSGAVSDAVVPTFELHYRNWRFGLSYDINVSEFEVATLNRGGPEFSVIYLITKVKPVKSFKACPIF